MEGLLPCWRLQAAVVGGRQAVDVHLEATGVQAVGWSVASQLVVLLTPRVRCLAVAAALHLLASAIPLALTWRERIPTAMEITNMGAGGQGYVGGGSASFVYSATSSYGSTTPNCGGGGGSSYVSSNLTNSSNIAGSASSPAQTLNAYYLSSSVAERAFDRWTAASAYGGTGNGWLNLGTGTGNNAVRCGGPGLVVFDVSYASSSPSVTASPSPSPTITQTSSATSSITPSRSSTSASTASSTISSSIFATETTTSSVTPTLTPTSTPPPPRLQHSLLPPIAASLPPPGFDAVIGDLHAPVGLSLSLTPLSVPLSHRASFLAANPSYWAFACSVQGALLGDAGLPSAVHAPTNASGSTFVALSPSLIPINFTVDGSSVFFDASAANFVGIEIVGLLNPNNTDPVQLRAFQVMCTIVAVPEIEAPSIRSAPIDIASQMSLAAKLVGAYGLHGAAQAASLGLSTVLQTQSFFLLHVTSFSIPLFSAVVLPSGDGMVRCAWDTAPSHYVPAPPVDASSANKVAVYNEACSHALTPVPPTASSCAAPPGPVGKPVTLELQLSGPTRLVLLGGSWLGGGAVPPFFDSTTSVSVGGIACPVEWLASDGSMVSFITPPISPFCQQGGISGTIDAAAVSFVEASAVGSNNALLNGLCGNVTLTVSQNSSGVPVDLTSTAGVSAALLKPRVSRVATSISCPPVCPTLPSPCSMMSTPQTLIVPSGQYPPIDIVNVTIMTASLALGMTTNTLLPASSPPAIFYSPRCDNYTDPASGLCNNAADPASLHCAYISLQTGQCVQCPAGALCPSGIRVWPRPGFWVANEYSPESLVRCTPPAFERCEGWDAQTLKTQCGASYRSGSSLCGMCRSGHYAHSSGACVACPPSATLWDRLAPGFALAGILLAIALFCFLLVLFVRAMFGGTVKQGLQRSFVFILWLIQILQIVAQSGAMSSNNLPSYLTQLYSSLQVILFEGFAVPPACTGSSPLSTPLFKVVAGCLIGLLYCCFMIYQWCYEKPWLQCEDVGFTRAKERSQSSTAGRDSSKKCGGLLCLPPQQTTRAARCRCLSISNSRSLPETPSGWIGLLLRALFLGGSLAYPTISSEAIKLSTCELIRTSASEYILFYDGDGSTLIHAGMDPVAVKRSVELQQSGEPLSQAATDLLATLLDVSVLRAYPTAVCGEASQLAAYPVAICALLFFSCGFSILSLVLLLVILAERSRDPKRSALLSPPQAASSSPCDGLKQNKLSYLGRRFCCCARDAADEDRLDGDSRFNIDNSLAFFLSSGVFRSSRFFHRQLDWLSLLTLSFSQFSTIGGKQALSSLGGIIGVYALSVFIPLIALSLLICERPAVKGAEWIIHIKIATTAVFIIAASLNAAQAYSGWLEASGRQSLSSALAYFSLFTYSSILVLFGVLLALFVRSLIVGALAEQRQNKSARSSSTPLEASSVQTLPGVDAGSAETQANPIIRPNLPSANSKITIVPCSSQLLDCPTPVEKDTSNGATRDVSLFRSAMAAAACAGSGNVSLLDRSQIRADAKTSKRSFITEGLACDGAQGTGTKLASRNALQYSSRQLVSPAATDSLTSTLSSRYAPLRVRLSKRSSRISTPSSAVEQIERNIAESPFLLLRELSNKSPGGSEGGRTAYWSEIKN